MTGAREVPTRLRVVVADDERPARAFLVALLRDCHDVDVVGEAADGAEAVAVIERERPDLALLDLQMPEVDGLGVVRLLRRDVLPLVAFVTAYDHHAVSAFELQRHRLPAQAGRGAAAAAHAHARATSGWSAPTGGPRAPTRPAGWRAPPTRWPRPRRRPRRCAASRCDTATT
jgi:CheY-like chemotaxis protein